VLPFLWGKCVAQRSHISCFILQPLQEKMCHLLFF
jgi:hypothetical protein